MGGELGSPSRAWIWHDGMNTKETLLSLLLLNGWHEYSDAINNVPWSGLLCCLILLPFCSLTQPIPHSFSSIPLTYAPKGNPNLLLVGNWDFTLFERIILISLHRHVIFQLIPPQANSTSVIKQRFKCLYLSNLGWVYAFVLKNLKQSF